MTPFQSFLQVVIGVASVIIAFMVYRHYKRQQRDLFFREMTASYKDFWNDGEMRRVRSWIANKDAYSLVAEIFCLRRKIEGDMNTRALTKEEYEMIDIFDRFCSLMVRLVAVHQEFQKRMAAWGDELWEYWLMACFKDDRLADLQWYMHTFWPNLARHGVEITRLKPQQK